MNTQLQTSVMEKLITVSESTEVLQCQIHLDLFTSQQAVTLKGHVMSFPEA